MTSNAKMDNGAFAPIQRDRAFEGVVSQIEKAILDGTYKVGDHLPSERELVEQFKVGRSTVREALRILESMGLVRTTQGSRKGVEVAGLVTHSLTRILHSAVALEAIPLVDLIEYRMITGAAGNFLAAERRTDNHLDSMERAIRQMRECVDDSHAFARADVAFHTAILDATGNVLLQMISSVVESSMVELIADRVADSEDGPLREYFIEQHELLLEAIRKRRGDQAARIARTSLYEAYGPALDAPDRERIAAIAKNHGLAADQP